MFGVLVGLDFEGRGQRFAGAGGRVVGERVDGMLDRCGFAVMQPVSARPAQPAGSPGVAFGEALGVVACFGGEAPEGQLGGGQRGELGDV